ncbi:hypothetical protein V1525DRAFT_396754 [Lipomyces kononenkoae]|uniref:Uncharacterized protein n=1 Tax=Lipomyces kononenkoae TaxID=34357 RepID=A0ACC3T806_LIPKO
MEACNRKRLIVGVAMLVTGLLELIALLQLSNIVRLGLPIPCFVPTLAAVLPIVTLLLSILPVACSRIFAERRLFYPAIVAGNILFAGRVLGKLYCRFVRSHRHNFYEKKWEHWFQKKSCKIGRIERALQCCGFSTPYDRAFPFADNDSESGMCVKEYQFTEPCGQKWAYETEMVVKSCMFVFFIVLLASFVCLFRWIRAYRKSKALSREFDVGDEESDNDEASTTEFSEIVKMKDDATEAQVPSDDPPSYYVVESRS